MCVDDFRLSAISITNGLRAPLFAALLAGVAAMLVVFQPGAAPVSAGAMSGNAGLIGAAPQQAGGDYGADHDGLIEIRDLDQLNAVPWDLDGDDVTETIRTAPGYADDFTRNPEEDFNGLSHASGGGAAGSSVAATATAEDDGSAVFTAVSAGGVHTCGLRTDGTVACWGSNPSGAATPPDGTFTQVSAGGGYTCGLRTDGTVACWGSGGGDPPDGTFAQVSAGMWYACGVRTDGTVACWGRNQSGQATPPDGTFTQVSAGSQHACGVRTDGTIACWGSNSHGQARPPDGTFAQVSAGFISFGVSSHTCGLRTDSTVACWGAYGNYGARPPDGTFAQVSAGGEYTCGVKTDGTVACRGDDEYGRATPPDGTFTQVSAGSAHTCGVRIDGTVACWGSNSHGQATPPDGTFAQVSVGYNSHSKISHTCVVRGDGTVTCWGYDRFGQATPPDGAFAQVSSGWDYTCGVRTDGTVACWGDDEYGQATPPDGTFTQVSAGSVHTCGLRTDGTVACWGYNSDGRATPPDGTFVQVSAGSCGVRTDGTIACWGRNQGGQSWVPLDGTFAQISTSGWYPCGVRTDGTVACWGSNSSGATTPPSGTFTQVSTGWDYTCGVKTDGTVACWGDDEYGRATPPDGTFAQVSAGSAHACGVRTDGGLACWGSEARTAVTQPAAPADSQQGDYDADADGLIEVSNLEQLNAIRWDLDGDGTPEDAGYFQAFPGAVDGMGCPAAGCSGYELTADLDFDTNGNGEADPGDAYWNDGAGWMPIGEPTEYGYASGDVTPDGRYEPPTVIIVQFERPFEAAFDGNGHTISNLHIYRPEQDSVGLFGYAGYSSNIEELGLVSVNVTGHFEVSALIGLNRGTVTSSYATGNVSGTIDVGGLAGDNSGTITTSYAIGDVTSSHRAGGLIGHNIGTVTASYALGNITVQYSAAGGLVGLNNTGVITACYATGSVSGNAQVGGLVGLHMNEGTITASYATGRVVGHESVGGLVGQNVHSAIIVSYWDIQTSAQTVGVGQGEAIGAEGKTTVELQAPTSNTGIYASWDSDIWDFGTSNQYPVLHNFGPSSPPPTTPTVLLASPHIYWVDEEAQKIQGIIRKDDVQSVADLATSAQGLDMPGSIAVDVANGMVYWTDDGDGDPQTPDGAIRRVNLDGSGSVENVKAGLADPVGIALDVPGDKMYWIERTQGKVFRSNLDGSDMEELLGNLHLPHQIALDTVKGRMYWTERGGSKIRWADLEGNKVTDLVRYGNPFGLALDLLAGKMYWTERGSGLDGRDLIARADLDGQNIEVLINAEPYSLSGIAVDTATGKIYWSDETTGSIWRADPDDVFDTTEKVITGLSAPEGLAIARSPDAAPLRALYEVTDGDDWRVTRGWLSDAPIDEWYGVTTDDDGRVTRLDLGVNRLSRSIPSELGSLNRLNYLNLVGNGLSGSIPSKLGNLTALKQLDISRNGLIGTIPAELSRLENLVSLELDSNYLSGPIPPELGGLPKLETLNLSGNYLGLVFNCGHPLGCDPVSIPGELGNLSKLKDLDLRNNWLSGEMPSEIGKLANLETLDLSRNNFAGGMPKELGSLSNLTVLDLSENRLTGPIPPELGSLNNLSQLDLSANNLGLDPEVFSGLAALPIDVHVPIPTSLGNLTNLQDMDLSDNWLGGRIPAQLGGLANLETLNLSGNQLTWNIPGELGRLRNLRVLSLSDNQLFGPVPTELSFHTHPVELSRGDVGVLEHLRKLDLSNNALTENIPHGVGTITTLKSLDISNNFLDGSIPASLGYLTDLTMLDLSLNSLTGSIPTSLGNPRGLRRLDLHGNDLSGQFPEELSNLPLVFLNLDYNQLDEDPSWCIPFSEERAERLQLRPGERNLPDLCSEALGGNLKGLASLYETSSAEPKIDELKDLLGVKFQLGKIESFLEHETFNDVADHDITDATFDILDDALKGVGDQVILNSISDEQIISIWVAILQRLYASVGVEDPYRPAVVDRLYYPHDPSVLNIVFEDFPFPQITGHQVNPSHLLDDFRKYAGWKEKTNWLASEDFSEWHGVTTNDAGVVIGLDLSHNNLRGYIPENLLVDLPGLKWLNIRGNLLNEACISPDLLPLLLIGDFVSRSPEKLTDRQLEALSGKTDEELYNEFVDTYQGEEGSEATWLDIFYGHVMVGQAAGVSFAAGLVEEDDSESVIEELTKIPSWQKIFQKTARGIFKIPDDDSFGWGAKAIGPIMKTANRMLQYEALKQGAALCPPPALTRYTDNDGTAVDIVPMKDQSYQTDRDALVAMYHATGGAGWDNQTGWNTIDSDNEAPLHEWHGVTMKIQGTHDYCNQKETNCRVTELDLSGSGGAVFNISKWTISDINRAGNGLTGKIPPQLGNLGELKVLNLSRNNLNGSIPPQLGNLENLQELSLNGNELSNYDAENGNWDNPPIPPELGNLRQLKNLHLQDNKLRGWIPMELSELSLRGLRKANLDRDGEYQLFGCLPPNSDTAGQEHLFGIVNMLVIELATLPKGTGKGVTFVGKQIYKNFVKAKALPDFAVRLRITMGTVKYGRIGEAFALHGRTNLYKAVQWTNRTPAYRKAFYAGVSSVLAENALGAVGGPIERGVNLDINVFEPSLERISNLVEDIGGFDLDGEIVMDKVWCGG